MTNKASITFFILTTVFITGCQGMADLNKGVNTAIAIDKCSQETGIDITKIPSDKLRETLVQNEAFKVCMGSYRFIVQGNQFVPRPY